MGFEWDFSWDLMIATCILWWFNDDLMGNLTINGMLLFHLLMVIEWECDGNMTGIYPLVIQRSYWKWPFVVDLPIWLWVKIGHGDHPKNPSIIPLFSSDCLNLLNGYPSFAGAVNNLNVPCRSLTYRTPRRQKMLLQHGWCRTSTFCFLLYNKVYILETSAPGSPVYSLKCYQ